MELVNSIYDPQIRAGTCIKITFTEAKNNNAPNITKRIKAKWIINVKFAANSYIYF